MPHDDVAGACLTLLRITRPAWFMVYEGGRGQEDDDCASSRSQSFYF
jgi:hypothetical protein